MDETGILEGLGCNGLVLGSSEKKITLKKRVRSRCWTTILECISAAGRALTPLVIFKGKDLQQQWFPEELQFLDNWHFTTSPKGWTNDEIALQWLQQVFIPQTKPEKPSLRLLIVDGHGSHQTDDFMFECYTNSIYLLFLPSHASHVLQPLDVSCFSPIKAAYRRHIELSISYDDASPIGKAMFLQTYYLARQAGLTTRTILGGWRGSGLWPVNMAKPLLNPLVLPAAIVPATPLPIEKRKADLEDDSMKTPKRSQEVRSLMVHLTKQGEVDSTARRLFGKIGRGLDQQNLALAAAQSQIRQLQSKLDRIQHRKKQRIEPDPNGRFAQIAKVIEGRSRIQGLLEVSAAAAETASHEFEELCSEWQLQ